MAEECVNCNDIPEVDSHYINSLEDQERYDEP